MATTFRMCSQLMRKSLNLYSPLVANQQQLGRPPRALRCTAGTGRDVKPDATEEAAESARQESIDSQEQTPTDASRKDASEAWKAQTEKLKVELKEYEDKYKRSLAETENVRRRMQKQIADTRLFGIQGFCKDLLEVADILGQATQSVPPEHLTSDNPHLVNLYDGLTMTETQLEKVFTRNGLLKVNPAEGEKFDPNFHEALFQQPVPEGKESGTVAVTTKVGYKLHSRTIRPALVGVYK